MSSLDDMRAAIDKLVALVDETVHSGEMSVELVQTAARMIHPVIQILRTDVRLFETANTDELMARTERAHAGAGDRALVAAILGPQLPNDRKDES